MPDHPWERLENENAKQWEWFRLYRDAGPSRQKVIVYRQVSGNFKAKVPGGYFSKTSKDFHWEERARAYDQNLEAAILGKRSAIVERDSGNWAKWLIENRENAAIGAAAVLLKFVDMAQHPLTRQRTEENGKVTIIEPIGWRELEHATKAAKLAMEIAAGVGTLEVTPRKLELSGNVEVNHHDLRERLTAEPELRRAVRSALVVLGRRPGPDGNGVERPSLVNGKAS